MLLTSFVCLVFLVGCEHPRVTFDGRPQTPYHKLLAKQTKYKRMYGLEKVIYQTHASYFTPELARLYVEEYADIYRFSDQERQAMHQEWEEKLEEYDVFMVSHFASDVDYDDLNEHAPGKKIWSLRLEDQDESIRPALIDKRTINAQERHFFPHTSDGFEKLYEIRFRKSTMPTKIFSMNSPAKLVTFTWKPSRT
jgi:hypothetical protein